MKTYVFTNLVELSPTNPSTSFQKYSVCVKKCPFRFLCWRLVLALLVETCQDFDSSVLYCQVQLLAFDNRVYPIILILEQDLVPA